MKGQVIRLGKKSGYIGTNTNFILFNLTNCKFNFEPKIGDMVNFELHNNWPVNISLKPFQSEKARDNYQVRGSVLRANRKWCRMYNKVFDPQRPSNKEFKDFVQSYLISFLKNPYAIFDYNKLSRESIKLQCLQVLRCFSREQNFILDFKKGIFFSYL